MNRITILSAFILFSITLSAQKIMYYNVWITSVHDDSVAKGYLYSADSDELIVIDNTEFDTSSLRHIDPKNIKTIKIRRKGRMGRGALIGGGAGVLTGVIIGGVNDADQISQGGLMMGSAVFFGAIGAGVGLMVGSHKKKMEISGNIETYENNLYLLRNFSVNK